MTDQLLKVRGLSAELGRPPRSVTAIRAIDFEIDKGEIVALVGESGSGKSTAAMALARLNEGKEGRLTGQITFAGQEVLQLPARALRQLRGRGIAMVFQDAMAALNPCETIGDQIVEAMVVHNTHGRRQARQRTVALLQEVGLPEPERRIGLYPHELSGGQRQRVMIALALACDPELLIADEPTTALDVTVQAQILALLRDVAARRNMALIVITHDLGVVAGIADKVMVMYAGRIVETAPSRAFFAAPRHPYSRDLIAAASISRDDAGRLVTIPGRPPHPNDLATGCAYAPRCKEAAARCSEERPLFKTGPDARKAACWFPLGSDRS